MIIFSSKINKVKKGFTLIETMVALAVLLIIIVPIANLLVQSIQSIDFTKDELIGGYLAQDAMEYVIANGRKSQGGSTWLSDFSGGSNKCTNNGTATNKQCTVDTVNNVIAACSPGSGCQQGTDNIKFDGTTYNYNTGQLTEFLRTVSINMINSNEASVVVTVSIKLKNQSKTITIKENIFND